MLRHVKTAALASAVLICVASQTFAQFGPQSVPTPDVPEPSSLIIWGGMLLAYYAFGFRRSKSR